MRVRATGSADRQHLQSLGDGAGDPAEGVVFVASCGLNDWPSAEGELVEAFDLAQAASVANAPIVFVVDSNAMAGRGSAPDAMVATGLVGGARALAFEGLRKERYVGIIATDSSGLDTLADTVRFAISTRAGLGQVLTLGTAHAGVLMP